MISGKTIFSILFTGLFFFQVAKAQHILIMIDRAPREIDTFYIENNYLKYSSHGSDKIKSILRSDVYAVKEKDGTEKVIYATDPLELNPYSKEEMKDYILGQEDARVGYRNVSNVMGGMGIAIGLAGATNALYGVSLIGVYPAFIGFIKPPKSNRLNFNRDFLTNPLYLDGYRTQARRMSMRRAFIGTCAGFIVGSITRIVLSK